MLGSTNNVHTRSFLYVPDIVSIIIGVNYIVGVVVVDGIVAGIIENNAHQVVAGVIVCNGVIVGIIENDANRVVRCTIIGNVAVIGIIKMYSISLETTYHCEATDIHIVRGYIEDMISWSSGVHDC